MVMQIKLVVVVVVLIDIRKPGVLTIYIGKLGIPVGKSRHSAIPFGKLKKLKWAVF